MARSLLSDYWNIKGLVIVSSYGYISFVRLLEYQRVSYSQFIWLDLLCLVTVIPKD